MVAKEEKMEPKGTYISLFSGAGVGCYGFKMEDFECIATNEVIERRLNVQKFNKKCKYDTGYICGDITTNDIKKRLFDEIKIWKQKEGIDDVDVVIATPPCQGMSVANLKKNNESAQQESFAIIASFEQALSSGYVQLRELLATFRLTVQEANLQLALEQVVASLRAQTNMQLSVNSQLPSQSLNPQQLVHLLQVVREATLNAIKHSKGTTVDIIAHTNAEGEYEILIQDNGVGIPSLDEPEGHYGLNIMAERCSQLNAELTISRREQGGTQVKITLPQKLF